jgi:hypothetical protein
MIELTGDLLKLLSIFWFSDRIGSLAHTCGMAPVGLIADRRKLEIQGCDAAASARARVGLLH